MAADNRDGFHGTLFPVFVTVDATLDELNQLIRRSDEFLFEAHMHETTDLYFISDADIKHPTTRQTWPLPASFESPFVGKSVADLASTFKSKLSRKRDAPEDDFFPDFTFGIVDAQTLKEGMLLCVSTLEGKTETCRADIEHAAMIMMGPEVTANPITEGLKAEADGQYYDRLDDEKRKQYLEGSDDEEEDEDDEE